MRNVLVVSMLVLLPFASACNQKQETASEAPAESAASASALTPEQLGELGAQVRKSPDRATEILSQHGMTPQSFESAIRKVTEDPDASKRYAAAYRKASS